MFVGVRITETNLGSFVMIAMIIITIIKIALTLQSLPENTYECYRLVHSQKIIKNRENVENFGHLVRGKSGIKE